MLEALRQLGIKADYEMIGDMNVIKAAGLKYTPAIEINDILISQGKYYSLAEMIELFRQYV